MIVEYLADVGRHLQVPQDCCDCACERIVYFIELTIPFEDAVKEAFEKNKLKYVKLVA